MDDNADLLSGTSNDNKTHLICSKLPWEDVYRLASLNREWKQTVESREIYNFRVLNGSTDAVVVMNSPKDANEQALHLFSLRNNTLRRLPPIPLVETGIPLRCQFVTLDGKLYVLGGRPREWTPEFADMSAEVYVLDLAGAKPWTKRANMLRPRQSFGCAVFQGKIYVCGGWSFWGAIDNTEVYDPVVDAWTSVTPMPCLRQGHEVQTVGDELVVHRGKLNDRHNCRWQRVRWNEDLLRNDCTVQFMQTWGIAPLDVYNPVQDTWRTMKAHPSWNFFDQKIEKLFMAKGKVHCISQDNHRIYVYEGEKKSSLHSSTFEAEPELDFDSLEIEAVLEVDGELVATFTCITVPLEEASDGQARYAMGLLRSTGFGTTQPRIVWRAVHWESYSRYLWDPPVTMRLLRL